MSVSPDPQNTPRQRRFDQQVAKVVNDLIRNGAITLTPGGWTGGSSGSTSSVLEMRAFNFTPRYGTWG